MSNNTSMANLSLFRYQPKVVNESKQDWINFEDKFGTDNMELFKKLQPKMTDNVKKSISYWNNKSRDELETYLFDLQVKPTRKEKESEAKKGADLIYGDDDWVVYDIKSFEASTYYGRNTRWCICGTKVYDNGKTGKDYFDEYTKDLGLKIYFFIKRRSNEKYAVVKDSRCHSYEVFNADDKTVENNFLPKIKELEDYENILTETLLDNEKWNVSKVKNTVRRGLVVVDCKFNQGQGFGYNSNWGGFMSPNRGEYLDEEILRKRGEDFEFILDLLHEKGIIK